MLPRILCVDDEPEILKSLALHLRKEYQVLTAVSGAEGLKVLKTVNDVAVVLSDMRMPGMDGAAFLSQAREICPDAVRMLLTGQTDIELAARAINEGQIFRFLIKPCPPDQLRQAIAAALKQHHLITAEKVLLQKTLLGSIKALVDVLAIINPVAFSHATRIRQYALELAQAIGVQEPWQVEAAALLSQIGYISLPPEILEKIYYGEALNWEEKTLLAGVPKVAEQLLRNIPRLEPVLEILAQIDKPLGKNGELSQTVPLGARILKIAIDFDRLKARGGSGRFALDALRQDKEHYDQALLEAFARSQGVGEEDNALQEIPLHQVKVGMILKDELRTKSGLLIAGYDFEVTETFLARVRHIDPSLLNKVVKVVDSSQKKPESG
jgi:response regulator RpfG family c-di-GMP phosphodiesterase